MKLLFKIALLSLVILSPQRVNAEELYGLAMHGQPKYGPEDKHLDYANPSAPKGGKIVHAAIGTFDTLNPYSIKGKAATGLNLVYDRLMGRVWDEPFTMYPLIAEKVEVPEDRSSLTVHINPKAHFNDGSSITADDVIFSFKTLRDEGRPNMRRVYRLAEKVEKLGPLSLRFEFGEGYDRETVMIFAMMPVLSSKWWEGRTFDSAVLKTPLTNGPYKIAEVDPGRKIVYERDPGYWAKDLLTNVGHHNFERIVYEYFRDDTVAFEAFRAGEVQLRREWDAGRWADSYDFPAVKEGRVIAEELPHGRPEKVRSLIFNTRRPPFDDIRVRKALSKLIDYKWINETLFHGKYRRINSFYPNSELAAIGAPDEMQLEILEPWRRKVPEEVFRANVPPVKQLRSRMRNADRLLKEAGWEVEKGIRVKNGQPFKFEIVLGSPEDEKIALAFARSLSKMGIKANVRVLDSAAYLARMNEYDFDMTLYHWLSSLSPGTEQYLYWSCEAANQPARWNYAGICDPAVDEISKSIAFAATRIELVASVKALDRVLMAGNYMIPLFYSGRDYVAYWKGISRPEKTPLYGMVIETWWMENQTID
jgi:ABC-type oligopeptide transport system substrate-binding subunit